MPKNNYKSDYSAEVEDRNGREIYEGDIITTPNGGWGVVVVKDHCFEVTVSAEYASLYTKEFLQNSKTIGIVREKYFEFIENLQQPICALESEL